MAGTFLPGRLSILQLAKKFCDTNADDLVAVANFLVYILASDIP